ncbi:MAG: TRAP transporter substrate-binding protein DctP [Deltaproteobacteria bacterium]|nr:TRAP transporter substrate-binding protein DctP [Deltaproteobacteria bacterium]
MKRSGLAKTLALTTLALFFCCNTSLAESSKPITWKLLDYDSPVANTVYNENLFQWWAKEVNKRTSGRIQVQVFHSEMLAKTGDFLTALDTGIADVAHVPIPAYPGRFPVTEFLTDTPVCYGDARLIAAVIKNLTAAGLMKEYEGPKPVSHLYAGTMCLFTTKKKISKLEDLKGLKIRARGASSSRLVESLGATPVTIGNADLYTALERGTTDGLVTSLTYVEYAKLYEVTKYFVDHGLTGGVRFLMVGKRQWSNLSPDLQQILLQLGEETSARYARGSVLEAEKGRQAFKNSGGTIYKLDPEEWGRFRKVMDSVVEALSGGLQAKGVRWAEVKEIIDSTKRSYKPE